MKVRMISGESAEAGWAAAVMRAGVKALWRPLPFGRTAWTFKRGDAWIELVQDRTRPYSVDLGTCTGAQQSILDVLAAKGVAQVVAPA